jgi:hypothetical protein
MNNGHWILLIFLLLMAVIVGVWFSGLWNCCDLNP